jgi:formate transporter FocA
MSRPAREEKALDPDVEGSEMATEIQIDAFPPAKMASRMEEVGVTKAELRTETMFALAILAGAFIGCGAIFATTVMTGLPSAGMGYGVVRLLGGMAFCLGLVAVVVAGAELFTGNNLIIMAFAGGRITLAQLLRNWGIVYVGNFVGSILTALVMLLTRQYTFAGGRLGTSALTIANAKCSLAFPQAIALGVMCNALVCLAVWLCSSARSTTDRILAIIFPITAFVAAGFEHSVANMYFIPMGLFIKSTAPPEFWKTVGMAASDLTDLTWSAFFLRNLLPVTIGNIIGGAGFVGLVYWFIYLQPQRVAKIAEEAAARILVVDDDPGFVDISRRILASEGYVVTEAANGEQALQAMREHRPDLILLDVMMSTPLDGVEVVRKMRSEPALAEIPIIMISSIDSSQHAAKLPDDMRVPIDAWISKPVQPEHLLRKVRRFLA